MRVLGWIAWGFEACAAAALVVIAPIAAVYQFVTGDAHEGWICLALFAGGVAYLGMLAFDVIERPRTRPPS